MITECVSIVTFEPHRENVPRASAGGDFRYTVEPPNSGRVGNFDDVPYSEVEP